MTEVQGIDLPLVHAGKVRRLYALPDVEALPDAAPDGNRAVGRFLMVASDAISAFDHVLATPIPDKGAVLTQLSLWWFDQLGDVIDNHVVSTDVPASVQGRAIVTERLDMVPVECVARGYLTGSGWVEYQLTRSVCGVLLPEGLVDGDRLPEPIFTPAVKAPLGEHDENVPFETVVELHGEALANELRDRTIELYRRAEEIARERGIILADTKFEFGRRPDGTLVLADEVLTPDSSRFWDAAGWRPGESLPSFDKQFVRDWLAHDSGWDRASDTPPPPLPDDVVDATRARYVEAYERLTGRPFDATRASVPGDASTPAPDAALASTLGDGSAPAPDDTSTPTPGDGSRSPSGEVGDAERRQAAPVASDSMTTMARVVVDVMPKPEILDPQGKAVTGALERLGFSGLTVRQGKRFEVTVDGDITDEVLAQVRDAAEKLLANTVIEAFDVRVEAQ